MTYIDLATTAAWLLMSIMIMTRFIAILQSERYHTDSYLKWVMDGGGLKVYSPVKYDKPLHFVCLAIMASYYFSPYKVHIEQLILTAGAVYWTLTHFRGVKSGKKPFALTARVKRLFVITIALEGLLLFVAYLFGMRMFIALIVLFAYMQPFLIALANIIAKPVEQFFQQGFKRAAMKKIAGKRVVAITGSYGKTGTKEAVAHMLETAYPLLKTPGSYNTPMGLCKVINDEMSPHHEIFVSEMGATRKGDIKELCEIARPSIAVITSIGEAHMESFGSIENVASTKFEIAEALPDDGVLAYNSDYKLARERAGAIPQRTVTFGFENGAEYRPYNIRCDSRGSTFDLQTPGGVVEGIGIKLLGRLNVINVVAGFVVGELMGVGRDKLKNAAATLPQMEARLQLLSTGSYLVINDGFNSNLLGAKAATETLSYFEGYRRILVTPGIVDLGHKHEVINFDFGKSAARNCDQAILINERRTKPLKNGLLAGGMKPDDIKVFPSLAEAREFIDETVGEGSVVLFENDLPDHMEVF
ncbi:MAG: UDP-N-acetylmuramoyl-tripeptide--D-alanyl-D-alanine ligase [Nitrospinota bacterium]|nr:UDP-N-acetylmuramoyl-tripeptide--D-alanyl-D-alanine ligase [Nitrospinota bacterium]